LIEPPPRKSRTVLHVSPHPDDELIGAPATLMALRDAGWRVVNLACSLGRPEQRRRRERELREACRLARFELRLAEQPLAIGSTSDADPGPPRSQIAELVAAEIELAAPALLVSPDLSERHPGHRVVAEGVREALQALRRPPVWWAWELWGSLPQPTLGTPFDRPRLEEVLAALAAYRGELARNDYRRFVRARAEMNASLAAELLFGFGASAPTGASYVELLTELVPIGGRWLLGRRRWLDGEAPLAQPQEGATEVDLG
jgi:LmbE family N-acetylglucosaminyl deacetylase